MKGKVSKVVMGLSKCYQVCKGFPALSNPLPSPSPPDRGRALYQLALTLCRFVAWNYFADLRMEVLKVTQHPENWSIQARWRITGLPFHVLLFRFYKKDKADLYR